jgi:hypothetical protein
MKETIFMTLFTTLLFTLKVTGTVALSWVDVFAPFLIYFIMIGVFTWMLLKSKSGRNRLVDYIQRNNNP